MKDLEAIVRKLTDEQLEKRIEECNSNSEDGLFNLIKPMILMLCKDEQKRRLNDKARAV